MKDLSVYYVGSMELQGVCEGFVCILCCVVRSFKVFVKDLSVYYVGSV